MPTLRYRRIGAFLWWGGYQLVDDVRYRSSITGYSIQDKWYRLDPDGALFIYDGYAWDGPTNAIKTKDFVAGSCIHDVFCELIAAGLLPESEQCKADEEMLRINIKSKMHSFRRAYTYAAVRTYQLRQSKPHHQKIYEVTF